jgi:hypothetical protein
LGAVFHLLTNRAERAGQRERHADLDGIRGMAEARQGSAGECRA